MVRPYRPPSSPARMTEVWRVFPWDPEAGSGEPFSPSYVPRTTGRGRFDLPVDHSPVLYVAESPEHAVAEALQPWRNRRLTSRHLERAGRRLAVVRVRVPDDPELALADLCDAEALMELATGPDRIASRHRRVTQPIARAVWEAGHPGLRWWSAFWGDWHGAVLFMARLGGVRFDEPRPLSLDTPAVTVAAEALGMPRVAGS